MGKSNENLATFAAGCFWCLDAILRMTKGILKVESGYSGGTTSNPSYMDLHQRDTGHAECVQVVFDPEVISYETLLEIFWTSHNPTTPNRDGANVGSEYRSVVFYHNETQKKAAEESKANVATELWDDPIVTEIVPFEKFYTAEEYHQNYYYQKPEAGYCQIVINPKLEKFKKRFAEYVRSEPLVND